MRNLSPERKYVARYNSNWEAWAQKVLGGNSIGRAPLHPKKETK